MRKSVLTFVIIIVVLSLSLSACTKNQPTDSIAGKDIDNQNTNNEIQPTLPPDVPEATPDDSEPNADPIPDANQAFDIERKNEYENTVFSVNTQAEAAQVFVDAIQVFADTIQFDLSEMGLKSGEEQILVQNSYFGVLYDHPQLKYAYDIKQEQVDSTVICTISYMPYKLGGFDESTLDDGVHKIYTLMDLVNAANQSIGRDNIPIAILNSSLDVDDMQNALQQAGYSYIVFMLNNDGTQIIASPTNMRTTTESLDYISKTKALAHDIYSRIITDEMSDDEKVEAIYNYITSTVKYDYRYYNAPATMPYESTTAYGAYKFQTAICGGNSWAVKMLVDIAGVECYNVTGTMYTGEYHMWNLIKYKGEFKYFDATWDLGASSESDYRYFAKTADEFQPEHQWNDELYHKYLNNY